MRSIARHRRFPVLRNGILLLLVASSSGLATARSAGPLPPRHQCHHKARAWHERHAAYEQTEPRKTGLHEQNDVEHREYHIQYEGYDREGEHGSGHADGILLATTLATIATAFIGMLTVMNAVFSARSLHGKERGWLRIENLVAEPSGIAFDVVNDGMSSVRGIVLDGRGGVGRVWRRRRVPLSAVCIEALPSRAREKVRLAAKGAVVDGAGLVIRARYVDHAGVLRRDARRYAVVSGSARLVAWRSGVLARSLG